MTKTGTRDQVGRILTLPREKAIALPRYSSSILSTLSIPSSILPVTP
ncbi:MAG TPA: hypothetical protein VNX46_15430 [Candidatus Acidoferrum sp.]|nr:hypothetical protein [Candidatus Acidoferrum sp.]